jgi:tRNA threonylcarbamoyladenosine modification (KEOPS) complex Cgi121 subunit
MSTVIEIDCSTGVSVERDMTEAELAAQAAMAAQVEAERLAAEEAKAALDALKASARAKLVAGTPLTEEEAATLVI